MYRRLAQESTSPRCLGLLLFASGLQTVSHFTPFNTVKIWEFNDKRLLGFVLYYM